VERVKGNPPFKLIEVVMQLLL